MSRSEKCNFGPPRKMTLDMLIDFWGHISERSKMPLFWTFSGFRGFGLWSRFGRLQAQVIENVFCSWRCWGSPHPIRMMSETSQPISESHSFLDGLFLTICQRVREHGRRWENRGNPEILTNWFDKFNKVVVQWYLRLRGRHFVALVLVSSVRATLLAVAYS